MMSSLFQCGQYIIASNVRPLWGRFDHQRPTFNDTYSWTLLSIAALLITVVVVAYRSSQRRQRVFIHDNPRQLFRELCRAHRLPFASRRLLKRLAAAHGLSDPATLFVNSAHFEISGLPPGLQPAAAKIRTLRNLLFG